MFCPLNIEELEKGDNKCNLFNEYLKLMKSYKLTAIYVGIKLEFN